MNDCTNNGAVVVSNVTDVLNDKVVMLIADMTNDRLIFTAFDVTSKIREENPTMDVPHKEVKEMVVDLYCSDFQDDYSSECIELVKDSKPFRAYVYHPKTASPYDHPLAVKPITAPSADTDLTVEKRLNIPKTDLMPLGLVAGKKVRLDVNAVDGCIELSECTSSPYETLTVNSDGRLRLNAKTLTSAFGRLPDHYEITRNLDDTMIIVKAK